MSEPFSAAPSTERESRLLGEQEAAAMFDVIGKRLPADSCASNWLLEIQGERALLIEARTALLRLLIAVRSENFSRPARAREMSQGLRVAINDAKKVLDA